MVSFQAVRTPGKSGFITRRSVVQVHPSPPFYSVTYARIHRNLNAEIGVSAHLVSTSARYRLTCGHWLPFSYFLNPRRLRRWLLRIISSLLGGECERSLLHQDIRLSSKSRIRQKKCAVGSCIAHAYGVRFHQHWEKTASAGSNPTRGVTAACRRG